MPLPLDEQWDMCAIHKAGKEHSRLGPQEREAPHQVETSEERVCVCASLPLSCYQADCGLSTRKPITVSTGVSAQHTSLLG